MNAKKIMGAVLVALLAAALFVGAGAAAGNGETVFVYQEVSSTDYNGTWINGVNSVTFAPTTTNSKVAIVGEGIVEGEYKKGDASIIVKYPTGAVLGKATVIKDNTIVYNIIDGIFYSSVSTAILTGANDVTDVSLDSLVITGANNVPVFKTFTAGTTEWGVTGLDAGTYKVQVHFAPKGFVSDIPVNYLYGKDVFTFEIKTTTDAEITAIADSIIVGETVKVVVTGVPGEQTILDVSGFTIPDQAALTKATFNTAHTQVEFKMPNTGAITIFLKAEKVGEGNAIVNNDASVDIEILEGEITAVADKESYFIGQDVTLSGTSTGATTLWLYVEGTNVDLMKLRGNVAVKSDKTWKKELSYDDLKGALNKLDAGTYTVYVATANSSSIDPSVMKNDIKAAGESYTTVSVVLKQPFLTANLQTSVVAQGSDLIVTGTAEAANKGLRYYIFGTNKFINGTQAVKKDSTYKITFPIPESMAAGQYFVVIQHPMYDGNFNIAPIGEAIYLNTTADAYLNGGDELFKVDMRQTANAAEALCQALDTQNIDDIYVKATFIVAAPTATMNPVPSEVAKGTKLTVSGTTNMAPGEIITVEMLSTAFAAVPKESVNSASFIALTTKVQDDGTWEVTFDTTGLNIDEYTITATAGQFVSTAKVNVVEKAPDTPVTPPADDDKPTDKPEEPKEEPTTPGFGALAALAGLGAVAVLLLRRE